MCMAIKLRSQINSFAHSLALKQRLRATPKWSIRFWGDRSYNSVTLAHQLSFAKGPLIQVSRPSFLSLGMNQIAGTFPTKCYRVRSLWALSLGGVFVIAICPTNRNARHNIWWQRLYYRKYCQDMFFPCLQTQGNSLHLLYLAQDMLSSHKPIVP